MQIIYWNIANGFNRWDARKIIDMSPMSPKVETSGYILKKYAKNMNWNIANGFNRWDARMITIYLQYLPRLKPRAIF